MKIGIIGTGYVGLPTGVCLAELGNDVVCIDNNVEKIKLLQNGNIFLFEENLEELFRKNIKSNRIKFTTSMNDGVSNADVVIIANEKNILDFRNILDLEMVKKFEFKYQRIGTKINKY